MPSKRRMIDDALYVHFVTFSVFRRRRLLDHDHPKRIVLGVLNALLIEADARCIGFVVLLDHLHVLLWFPQTGKLSGFMREWKRRSSLNIRQWYREHAPCYVAEFGEGERFWQPKSYSFETFSRWKLQEKLQDRHLNPVQKGSAHKAANWKWSSARWYERQQTVGIPIAKGKGVTKGKGVRRHCKL